MMKQMAGGETTGGFCVSVDEIKSEVRSQNALTNVDIYIYIHTQR